MTVCNMSIEAGARAGLIAPDETTFAYLKGRRFSPGTLSKDCHPERSAQRGVEGPAVSSAVDEAIWDQAVAHWRTLPSDPGAVFDRELHIDAATLAPAVTWGTSPGMTTTIDAARPTLADSITEADRKWYARAYEYMGLIPGTPIADIKIDTVFLGSCTNGRIEDLRAAAAIVKGHHVATKIRAMVVPGSQAVKRQAESEGLDAIFKTAGFEWREPGCSMCLGMNPDILQPGERCASTSNRNFEGRQGRGGRTHLVSPEMAAAAAIAGHFVDIRNWLVHEEVKA